MSEIVRDAASTLSEQLREFIRAAKLCAGNGTRLRVGGARGRVRRVFELTGIADVVGLEP